MHSPRRKPRRRLTRKEKGKRKVSDSGTLRNESDRPESDSEGTGVWSSKVKSASTEKASTSANVRLRRSTRCREVGKLHIESLQYDKYISKIKRILKCFIHKDHMHNTL